MNPDFYPIFAAWCGGILCAVMAYFLVRKGFGVGLVMPIVLTAALGLYVVAYLYTGGFGIGR